MTKYTEDRARQVLFEAIAQLRSEGATAGDITGALSDYFENWNFAEDAFIPDDVLVGRLDDYEKWISTRAGENAGRLRTLFIIS